MDIIAVCLTDIVLFLSAGLWYVLYVGQRLVSSS